MKMRYSPLITAVMAVIGVFVHPAHAIGIDATEREAYSQAVEVLVELQAPPPGSDASLRWSAGLKVLAQSKAKVADGYLADLALFKLDGEVGSEWSCAASKRAKNFAVFMNKQLARFGKGNSCAQLASARKLDAQQLCASRKEFERRVEQTHRVPQPDEDGACS